MINKSKLFEVGLYSTINHPADIVRKLSNTGYRLLKHSDSKRVGNLMLSQWEKRRGDIKLKSMPILYTVNPVNYCNLSCRQCLAGLNLIKRPPAMLKASDFKAIIDQITPYAFSIDMFSWGEPLLNPELWDIINLATEKNIGSRVASNLNKMDQSDFEGFFTSGLEEVLVALDGPNEDVYQTYRQNGGFQATKEHLQELALKKKLEKRFFPIITIRFLITSYSEPYLKETRRLAFDLGADNFIAAPIVLHNAMNHESQKWLPKDRRLSYYGQKPSKIGSACYYPWEQLVINPDGSVSPCCWFDEPDYNYGNILVNSLEEIWNNEIYQESRSFLRGDKKVYASLCSVCQGRPEEIY